MRCGARSGHGACEARVRPCQKHTVACGARERVRDWEVASQVTASLWQVRRDMSVEELKKEVADATSIAVESQRLMS